MFLRLEAEIEEAHLKAKEEMMQGIQMAKEVAQKELCDQRALYEDRIHALERELVHYTSISLFLLSAGEGIRMAKCTLYTVLCCEDSPQILTWSVCLQ